MGCCDKLMGSCKNCRLRCNDKLMTILNLVAAAMIIVCGVMRFVYFKKRNQEKNAPSIFDCILSAYILIFITLLILAEFRVVIIRKYFNFLDRKMGRGWFLLFMGLLILEKVTALEIVLGIFILLIAVINMIVGWGEPSDGKNAPMKQTTATEIEL